MESAAHCCDGACRHASPALLGEESAWSVRWPRRVDLRCIYLRDIAPVVVIILLLGSGLGIVLAVVAARGRVALPVRAVDVSVIELLLRDRTLHGLRQDGLR